MPRIKTIGGELWKQNQPVDGKPFGRSGLPETETDGHSARKKQDYVPGDFFQVLNIENVKEKESNGGTKQNACLVQSIESRNKIFQGNDQDGSNNDNYGQDLVSTPSTQLTIHYPGLSP